MKHTLVLFGFAIVLSNTGYSASAGAAATTFMTSLRNVVGFAIGYGNHTFYAQKNCPSQDPAPVDPADCTDAPPYKGLVGVAVTFVNELQTMLSAAGIGSCSDVPTTGSSSVTSSTGTAVTATYGTATHSIPSGWDNGGTAYTKKVFMDFTVASTATKISVEFACGVSSVYASANMLVGNHAPGYERRINIISGYEAGIKIADIYITEYHPTNQTTRGAYAIRAKIDEANSTYQIWSSTSGQSSNMSTMVRSIIHGNYSTNQASVFLKTFNYGISASYYVPATISAMSGSTASAVETPATYDFQQDWSAGAYQTAGNIYSQQGCVDFDTPTDALSSNALCSGLALSDPTAPSLSSSGAFNVVWPIQSMPALIDVTGLAVQ